MGAIHSRQYLESEAKLLVLEIDGSAVTTSYSNVGLLRGKHLATVKKGTGADSNLVTIKFKKPFGVTPNFVCDPITVDCMCRRDAASTNTLMYVRTLTAIGTGQKDDADFTVLVFGSTGQREGGSY